MHKTLFYLLKNFSGACPCPRTGARLVKSTLRSIIVPGFDVNVVSCSAVTEFRISRDVKKVAVFMDFTGSDPGCPFCKFVNYTVWSYMVKEIKERLREVGFEEVYVVDERRQMELAQRAVEVSESRPELVALVTYEIGFDVGKAVKTRQRLRDTGVELEIHRSLQPLHVKIYTNNENALLTSANLSRTSLFRNIEFALTITKHSRNSKYKDIGNSNKNTLNTKSNCGEANSTRICCVTILVTNASLCVGTTSVFTKRA